MHDWIQDFGKPKEILSDNDVRFNQEKGFWKSCFRSLGIDVDFGLPRHPQSNGLCERMNRSFLQNIRALSIELKTMDWPRLCPLVTWIMNSQISNQTGCKPSELFLGKPSLKFQVEPEPCTNPTVQTFLETQMLWQEKAIQRLEKLRERSMQRKNRRRVQSSYSPNDYVLVHNDRWPQRKIPKIESPWLGPFKIVDVHFNSLTILVSPSLGGKFVSQ